MLEQNTPLEQSDELAGAESILPRIEQLKVRSSYLIWAGSCVVLVGLLSVLLPGVNPWIPISVIFISLLIIGPGILILLGVHRQAVTFITKADERKYELVSRLTALRDHIHGLREFTLHLNGIIRIEDTYPAVVRMLVEHLQYDAAHFWVCDPDGTLRCIAGHGVSGPLYPFPASDGDDTDPMAKARTIIEKVLELGTSVAVRDNATASSLLPQETTEYGRIFGFSSFAIIPLVEKGTNFGAISAGRMSENVTTDTKDVHILRTLSQAAFTAIGKVTLQKIDERDKLLLTSISNAVQNALVKLSLFRDMEQQIERRTEELRKMQQQVFEAREQVYQSEKLSSLGHMAAGVIHEINDPLNFMVNILPELRADIDTLAKIKNVLHSSPLTPEHRKQYERIVAEYDLDTHLEEMDFIFSRAGEALQKSTRIAHGLKVFSSSTPDAIGPVDLLEAALRAAEIIPGKIRGATRIDISKKQGIVWKANGGQIEQVFMNLFINAIDAMEQNGTITVEGEKKGDSVEVQVIDTGPGIPADKLPRIFDPFFTTKPAGKSTGLGLSISSEIVRKFGGNLTVLKTGATGTTFSLLFSPVRLSETVDTAHRPSQKKVFGV